MTRIVLDDAVLSMLPKSSKTIVEICDSHGQVRGVFQALEPDEEFSLEPEISDEELDRRARLPIHGRTLTEILADWEKRK